MLVIHNAIHLSAPVNLLVEDDQVLTMTPASHVPACQAEIFDAHGLTLMPSLIDAHVHLREPGQEYKEDIESGLSAALHGGFGAVMCMANTRPVNDNPSVTRAMRMIARETHPDGPDLYPIGAATIALGGRELAPLAQLKEAGCVAISNDGKPVASSEMVRRIMEYAADLGLVFIDHCEDPDLAKGWIMNEGELSGRLGLKGQPGCGEAIQAARDILLAEYLNLPVHIAHVSSCQTVELIAFAKARGVQVTAETAPHYLLLTEESLAGYNSLARVSPPLRSHEDRESLRKAVANGTIDILATDHAPHAAHEKDGTLAEAPCGITGLDTALALSWKLVSENVLGEIDLHRLWAERPAEIFGLPCNRFMPGDPASFILFDPGEEWLIDKTQLHSKSHNTPFLGEKVRGRVKHHWIRGRQLF